MMRAVLLLAVVLTGFLALGMRFHFGVSMSGTQVGLLLLIFLFVVSVGILSLRRP